VSRDICVCLLVLSILVCTASGAVAAGFAILQQGTAAMAQGNAFVAQADDPSAVFYNPAGLMQLKRPEIYFNTVFSSTNRTYTSPAGQYTTAKHEIYMIPANYGVLPVHERVVLGFGFFSPFGLGTTWPPEWAGRYLTTMSKLQTFNLNPVVAVKLLDNLFFAAGLDVLYSKVQIQRRTLRFVPPLTEIKNDFEGDGFGFGYNIGLLYEPVEGVKLGASYRSEIKVTHSGDLKVSSVDPVGGEADVVFPPSVTWGIAYSRIKPFVFEFDVTWTGWSTYKNLGLNLKGPIPGTFPGTTISEISQEKNWNDAWAFRFGGNYEIRPGMKARVGYIYDQTPVPNSTFDPTVPDANRHIFTLGGDMQISRFTMGFAYNYIVSENRSKANTLAINGVPLPPAFQANGKYKSDNHSLGFSLACKF
jgi:long-chain fatty acid transport protein